jgi:conjugative relaxase-like TrwC/TraI family protein
VGDLPELAVVSLGKLTAGHEEYYEREVAGGAEDYYAMRGEAAGEWTGSGAEALGLEGAATSGQLRALLEGRNPATREMLRSRAVKVTGWDVTYSPPKSVSVLHAAGDRRIAAETLAAHRTGVCSALAYLEADACWTRRGAGGATRLMGDGFVAVEYVHRVSRAGDAQLHSHVVMANLTRADGRWTTLDGRALDANLKTASALYHAELRAELTRRLGVEWEPVVPGKVAAEIRGVPRAVLRDQSRRREEIVRRMADRGESSPRAAQAAALDTRRAKDHDVDRGDIAGELRVRIAEKGLGPAELSAVVDRQRLERPTTGAMLRASRELLGPRGLTEHRSTFSRGDVIQRWAAAHRQGESAERIVSLSDRWLARPEIVGLEPASVAAGGTSDQLPLVLADNRGELRYSTRSLVATEQALLGRVAAGRDAGVAIVSPAIVKRVLTAHPDLSPEQAALVWELTSSGHRIENVEAGAGAGKTHALGVAVEAFAAAGHPVLGTSTANLAARTLEQEAAVRARNSTRLLADLDGSETLAPGTVLLVDEAGMVGTRTYQRLAEHVIAVGGKLIGVGDSRQLAEIDAGGAFRAISDRFGAVGLPGNRRQVDPEEIRALAAMRDGDPDAYVFFEHQRGRITVAETPAQARDSQLADWWHAVERHPDQQAILVGLTRAQVAELNADAHALMRDAGRLGDDEITARDRAFATGDRVILLRNNTSLDVDNGDRGVVIAVDAGRRALTVELDAGRQVDLPDWYLDAGWVDHGYALTAHKLQSTTVDRTFALATSDLYQEAGYSIATRARHATHFYVASRPDVEDHERAHGPPRPPEDAITRFARHLSDSRAQTLASDEPARAQARALSTPDLRAEHDRVWNALNSFPGQQARALEGLDDDAQRLRARLAHSEGQIAHTAAELDGLSFLKRQGTDGDELRRALKRDQDHRAYTERLYADTIRQIAALRTDNDPVAWVDRNAEHVRFLRALDEELTVRERRAEYQLVRAAQTDPPEHITAVLGPRPENHAARLAWERGVHAIETYRHRNGIDPDHHTSALGPEPPRTRPNPAFRDTATAVRQARAELGLDTDPHRPEIPSPVERLSEPPERDRGIGRDDGLFLEF